FFKIMGDLDESGIFDASLSMWKGLNYEDEEFDPIPLDIFTAASLGESEIVQEILDRKAARLNSVNRLGWSALMYASYMGHENTVHCLLDNSADPNQRTPQGYSSIILASMCGNEHCIHVLIQQGGDINAVDKRGWSALLHSASAGHQQTTEFLIKCGANCEIMEPKHGLTPLMEAAASGHEIIVQQLLQKGVDVSRVNHQGENAWTLALAYDHRKIASMIEQHKIHRRPKNNNLPVIFKSLIQNIISGPLFSKPHGGFQTNLIINASTKSIDSITRLSLSNSKRCSLKDIFSSQIVLIKYSNTNLNITNIFCYKDITKILNRYVNHKNGKSSKDNNCGQSGPRIHAGPKAFAQMTGLGADGKPHPHSTVPHFFCSSIHTTKLLACYYIHKSRIASLQPNYSFWTSVLQDNPPHLNEDTRQPPWEGPKDLESLLHDIGCSKHLPIFQKQDIDLRIFLSLTEEDLKEIGITLFGPRRRMVSCIARLTSGIQVHLDRIESAYADALNAKQQRLQVKLKENQEEKEELKSQVAQERELRKVTESVLME
uniref:SAM domain-containing protein n=1 Tax=Ciona intestinalis TaxID=7719 RepID=H2XSN5_CIOIN